MTTDSPVTLTPPPDGYYEWLHDLKYMRAFAQAWPKPEFVQQAAAQLPWFHLCTLIDKLKTRLPRIEQIEQELAGGNAEGEE